MVTDLYLRSKAKVQVSDLWLHPADPDTGLPPTLSDSGTVTTLAALVGAEAFAEIAEAVSVASFGGLDRISEVATLTTTAALSGVEVLADSGALITVALLSGELPGVAGEFTPEFARRFIDPEPEFAEQSIELEPQFALAFSGRSSIG